MAVYFDIYSALHAFSRGLNLNTLHGLLSDLHVSPDYLLCAHAYRVFVKFRQYICLKDRELSY